MDSEVSYKRLNSGYHFARAVGHAHLFAQWPIGTELTIEHVSHHWQSIETIGDFIVAASKAAEAGENKRKGK